MNCKVYNCFKKFNMFVSGAVFVSIALLCIGSCGRKSESRVDTGVDTGSQGPDFLAEYLANGFVRIDAGTFIVGSPEDEVPICRAMYNEQQVEVILTRPFEMAKTEVTQAQWKAVGYPNPIESNDEFSPLLDDERPVSLVDWYEALAFCNKLSEKAGLETCYDLSNCTGDDIGSGCPRPNEYATWENGGCSLWEGADPFYCGFPVRKYESMYDCKGYRLPTTSEWEYAARAGTTEATYNGDIVHETYDCVVEPTLEPIAWYCANVEEIEEQGVYQRVGLKMPNPWGLYDMLGNVYEWTDSIYTGGGVEEDEWYANNAKPPLTDPTGHKDNGKRLERILRGGNYGKIGCRVRAARIMGGYGVTNRKVRIGFRPVRTL